MRNNIEKNFSTSYKDVRDVVTQEKFTTKERNDDFASGMELMGVKEITKSYYDPLVRKWFPYTDKIFYTNNV